MSMFERYAALVLLMSRALVNSPEIVSVEVVSQDDTATIRLTVAPHDLGSVIGKQGNTARSIRTILGAASKRDNLRVHLDIVSTDPKFAESSVDAQLRAHPV